MNYLTLITAILQLAITGIVAVENALPQKGVGATKKQIVMAGVEAAAGIGLQVLGGTSLTGSAEQTAQLNQTMQTASSFIDKTVGLLNQGRIGAFAAKAE